MDNPDALNRPYISADELIERIRRYHPDDDMDLVRRAYAFGEEAHKDKKRTVRGAVFYAPRAPWQLS